MVQRRRYKQKMSAQSYLDMWLSEQIPIEDWLKILDTNPQVESLYKKHIESNAKGVAIEKAVYNDLLKKEINK